MSEVKLNLIDAHNILSGTLHGSVADRCVAALSAEPETIAELEVALSRYQKPDTDSGAFACFHTSSLVDSEPWDAGLVIIDLAARIVATESTYSAPQPEGKVEYHNGEQATDIEVLYRLPSDWLFVNSFEAYRWSSERRREQRAANLPIDIRVTLYGLPLLEFIVDSGIADLVPPSQDDDEAGEVLVQKVSAIHANWLMTPREDLRGRSPREVILEKRELIDFDLHTRCLQWSFLGEGPPCLPLDSFAYRFAGFGTHEWVVYYDLVRHLLWSALELKGLSQDRKSSIAFLDKTKSEWLEQPQPDYDGKIPAIIIDNERKRLPQVMSPAELIIDDDCEICRMSALHAEMGYGPGFWHLDGSSMDDGFAFSTCLTTAEWEAELREREEFHREFDREWAERERLASGESEDVFGLEWLQTPEEDQADSDHDPPF